MRRNTYAIFIQKLPILAKKIDLVSTFEYQVQIIWQKFP